MLSPMLAVRDSWSHTTTGTNISEIPSASVAMDATHTMTDIEQTKQDVKSLMTNTQPEIPPHPPNSMQLISPHSLTRSPDDSSSGENSRSPSSYHGRRLSGGSNMQDETPTSGTSSMTSVTHVRQVSADSNSSISSNSVSPPAPSAFIQPTGFAFSSPVHANHTSSQMEDVTPQRTLFPNGTFPTQHYSATHPVKSVQDDHAMTDESMTAATDSMKISHPSAQTKAFTGPAYGSAASSNGHGSTSAVHTPHKPHHPTSAHSTPSHSPHVGPAAVIGGPTVKRGQGFSCHHCKTHKMPEMLLFCSNQSKKGPGKKRCRKKYCDSCLRRLYGHPADQPLSEVVGFQCPACLGNCVCAGCERKAAPAPSIESDSGAVSSNSSARSASPVPPLLSLNNSPSPSRDHKDRGQTKPTTPQGKPPGKKRRTSIDSGVNADEPRQEDVDQSQSLPPGEVLTITTPLLTHARRHSGEFGIPSTFHLPQASSLPFAVPSHGTLPPRSGSNSNSASPRLSAQSNAANRMIHIPAFSLQSPISVLNTTSGMFSSAIHQSVAAATAAAQGVGTQGAMDLSGSDHTQSNVASTGTGAMDTSNVGSTNSANNSPFSGSRTLARRTSSAFSPISTSLPISAPLTPELEPLTLSSSASIFSSMGSSPNTSPSILKRLMADQVASVGQGSMQHKPIQSTVGVGVPAPVGSPENELMKVLANAACSGTVNPNSALPPAHPPVKTDQPSPKLGYLGNPLLLSPTHALTLPPPATATLSPSSSLASLSAMKALQQQHAMEVQCLLQQQQQQLAELELRAMKEIEVQQQTMLHHQRVAQSSAVQSAAKSPLNTSRAIASNSPIQSPQKPDVNQDTHMMDVTPITSGSNTNSNPN